MSCILTSIVAMTTWRIFTHTHTRRQRRRRFTRRTSRPVPAASRAALHARLSDRTAGPRTPDPEPPRGVTPTTLLNGIIHLQETPGRQEVLIPERRRIEPALRYHPASGAGSPRVLKFIQVSSINNIKYTQS